MSDSRFNATDFYGYLAEKKLMGSRNRDSGILYVPPRPLCPKSYSDDMEWVELSGKGELTAFTVITVAPSHMIAEGYGFKNPYCAGIVKLEEGPSISGQIFGVDVGHPESIKIGMPVQATFIVRGEGNAQRTYLGFEAV
jgi:uncharacterized OB-fold protein